MRGEGGRGVALASLALAGVLCAPASPVVDGAAEPGVVVIDPGHGGPDFGARGVSGVPEKEIALRVARRLGAALAERGVRVVYTRERDEFVSLARRTEIANAARGGLFLSIHANSAPDPDVSGSETFFLSVDASDDDALRVALTENAVFNRPDAAPDSDDIVAGILGDLIRTDHLRGSRLVAAEIQRRLQLLPGSSRGVKQAPFVVLSGVNMPAALIELGFLTHPGDARRIGSRRHQDALARAIAAGVESYRRARNGAPPAEASP